MVTVYRIYARNRRLLYVGQTRHIMNRIWKHVREKEWAGEITTIKLQHFDTLDEALEAEKEAIASERPRFNVHYKSECYRVDPDGRRHFRDAVDFVADHNTGWAI